MNDYESLRFEMIDRVYFDYTKQMWSNFKNVVKPDKRFGDGETPCEKNETADPFCTYNLLYVWSKNCKEPGKTVFN